MLDVEQARLREQGFDGAAGDEIRVENPAGCCRGVVAAWLDDQPVDPAAIPVLQDGRTHQVRAILGKKAPGLQAGLSESPQVASGGALS